jgi:hypothetical protein
MRLPNDDPIRKRALAARERALAVLSPGQQKEEVMLFRYLLETEAQSRAESLKSLRSQLDVMYQDCPIHK